jgi:hypothetical protein
MLLQQSSRILVERETGLSKHTIIRVRGGRKVHPRTLQTLRTVAHTIPTRTSLREDDELGFTF